MQASSTDVYVASSATGETALPSVQSSAVAAAAVPSDTPSSDDDDDEEEEEDCEVQYEYGN